MIVPAVFFSISRSKLPGYILPAIPAGAVLLADYLFGHFKQNDSIPKLSAIFHAMIASAPIVPAVLISYLVIGTKPPIRLMLVSLTVAFVVCVAIAVTLLSPMRLRMLRFVTLIPTVLAVAAVLKIGTTTIDEKLSTRPLAKELATVETYRLPIAVCGATREVEFGLGFYRNQVVARYELGNVPAGEHLLVASPAWMHNVAEQTAGRRLTFLAHYAPQNLNYYWVSAVSGKH